MATLLMGSRIWEATGWTMIHFLWLGSLIGLLTGMGRVVLRRATANSRYLFLLLGFAALCATPCAIAWRIASIGNEGHSPGLSSAQVIQQQGSPGKGNVNEPSRTAPAKLRAPSGTEEPSGARNVPFSRWLSILALQLPWLWLFGAPVTFFFLLLGLCGAEHYRRQSRIPDDPKVIELFQALARSLGIAQRVALGACDRIASPILVGILRPMILLPPAALLACSPAEVEMILLHELAHVRRWDSLVNLLQRIAESILFFHPAVWWISRSIRLERECACDEVVLSRTTDPQRYAAVIAEFALPGSFAGAVVAALSEKEVVHRIRRILKAKSHSMRLSWKWLSGLFVLCILMPLACAFLEIPPETSGGSFSFLRFREAGEPQGGLETGHALYEGPEGAKVHLIATFPYAEHDYYQRQKELFSPCDVVLHDRAVRADPKGVAERLFELEESIADSVFTILFHLEKEDAAVNLSEDRFVRVERDTESDKSSTADSGDLSLLANGVRSDLNLFIKYARKKLAGAQAAPSDEETRGLKFLAARELVILMELAWPPARGEDEPKAQEEEGPEDKYDQAVVEKVQRLLQAGTKNIGLYFYPGRLSELEACLARLGQFKKVKKEWLTAWDVSNNAPAEKKDSDGK